MARKKKSFFSDLKYDILGIILLFFSVYSYVSLLNEKAGMIGTTIRAALLGVFGLGAYIFPILLTILGFGAIYLKSGLKMNIKFYSFCLFFIVFIVSCYMFDKRITYINGDSFIEVVIGSYESGLNVIGGGVLGSIIGFVLVKIIGPTGSTVLLLFALLLAGVMFTNVPLSIFFSQMKNKILVRLLSFKKNIVGLFANNKKETITNNITSSNEQVIIEDEKIEEIDKKIKILDFTKNFDKNFNSKVDSDAEIEQPEKKFSKVRELKRDLNTSATIQKDLSICIERQVFDYKLPDTNILTLPIESKVGNSKKEVINNANILNETLKSFGVSATVSQISKGPTITRYELQLSPGVKVSKIVNLSDDISLSLASAGVRIEAPIPGKAAVGIEVPNKDISIVHLREVIESPEFKNNKSKISFAIGKDVAGANIVADLAKMPHLLIAGATGSGKSVCINTLITSILYKAKPDEVKLLMIDPKVVELSIYNNIPHLLIPVVTDPKKASSALNWAVNEMTDRYKKFAANSVRDISGYNSLNKESLEKMPQIVVIIDELADLMMVAPGEVEDCICRLAQMARAAGIHLVVATQRPSVDVITGIIKANIPSRISFSVSSQIDSRTILDMGGAEKLLGKGDMLFYPSGEPKPIRVQGAFISEKEVEKLVSFIKDQTPTKYNEEIIKELDDEAAISNEEVDTLLKEAIRMVVETEQASVSMLQRRLRIGYNRAARLIDEMEARRIIGEYEGSRPRKVLISKEDFEEML